MASKKLLISVAACVAAAAGLVSVISFGGSAEEQLDHQVGVCEEFIKQSLKSPASFRRHSVTKRKTGPGKKGFTEVMIAFDAANRYGAVRRDIGVCTMSAGGYSLGAATLPHVVKARIAGRDFPNDWKLMPIWDSSAQAKWIKRTGMKRR